MTHLRQIMLEELRRRNYAESTIHDLHPHGRAFQSALPSFARSAWPGADSPVSGRVVHALEAGPEHRNAALGRFTLLLCTGVEARLERCRDTVSEEGSAPTAGAEPGRSGASDRRGRVSLSSHPADDALCHGRTSRRSGAPEDQRYRQPTHGHSYPGRQGTQGP